MIFSSLFHKKDENIYCSAIVLGAGQGIRMNSNVRKQFIEVLGKPVIVYALEAFQHCDDVDEIILVVPKEEIVYANDIVKAFELDKVTKIVPGGKRRQDSVLCGLKEITEKTDVVAVHDGARPLVRTEDIENVIEDALAFDAATLGVKAKDTMKLVDKSNMVLSTLDRECVYHIQTPQVFRREVLVRGYENAVKNEMEFTDDSALVEAIGVPVKVTQGSYDDIKITTPEDLIYMEAMVEFIEN